MLDQSSEAQQADHMVHPWQGHMEPQEQVVQQGSHLPVQYKNC